MVYRIFQTLYCDVHAVSLRAGRVALAMDTHATMEGTVVSLPSVPRQQRKCFLRIRSQELFSTGPIPGYISLESVKLVQF
jgi:hypothetical protein